MLSGVNRGLLFLLLTLPAALAVRRLADADETLDTLAGDGSAAAWQGEIIYSLMTDRFSLSPDVQGPSVACHLADWNNGERYRGLNAGWLHATIALLGRASATGACITSMLAAATAAAGSWAGISSRLDYIKQLGMTAVWMSPICAAWPGRGANGATGYHGWSSHPGTSASRVLHVMLQSCAQMHVLARGPCLTACCWLLLLLLLLQATGCSTSSNWSPTLATRPTCGC